MWKGLHDVRCRLPRPYSFASSVWIASIEAAGWHYRGFVAAFRPASVRQTLSPRWSSQPLLTANARASLVMS
jgi:hypothetical protein